MMYRARIKHGQEDILLPSVIFHVLQIHLVGFIEAVWTFGKEWLFERRLIIIQLLLRKHPGLDKTIFKIALRWRFDGLFAIHQDFFRKHGGVVDLLRLGLKKVFSASNQSLA